jgi:ribose 5-phosphate isomerase
MDSSKKVDQLGKKFPIALEIIPFGFEATKQRIERITAYLESSYLKGCRQDEVWKWKDGLCTQRRGKSSS